MGSLFGIALGITSILFTFCFPTKVKMPFQRRDRQRAKLRKGFLLRAFPQGGEDEPRLAAIHRTQLVMDSPPVPFQGTRGDSQLVGNEFVRQAFTGGLQDFLLSL